MDREGAALSRSDVLVTVCTYGRPEPLAAFLASYAADPGTADSVLLVVDNNPDGDARPLVEGVRSSRTVRYVHEPRPGIAAARNRCLAEWDVRFDALVFVDDDELVPPGWLDALVDCANTWDAAIVNGHVRTTYPEHAPAWVPRSGLFERGRPVTGSSDGLPATNNTLVRRSAWVRAGQPRFDEAFSRSGGSDTMFFWTLVHGHGVRFVWSAEAYVTEPLPDSRMSLRWAWRRHRRAGNVLGRVMLLERAPWRVLVGGVARVAKALVRGAAAVLMLRNPAYWLVGRVGRGVGMAASARQRVVVEYSRGGQAG